MHMQKCLGQVQDQRVSSKNRKNDLHTVNFPLLKNVNVATLVKEPHQVA